MLPLMFLVYSTKHSAHSENGDQRMRQVVAYKQWKIIKGAVSRNSAKLGNYKKPVKLRET